MHHTVARDKSPIFHLYIAGQQSPAGYDRMIADLAVMRHVRMMHEEIVVADDSGAAFDGAAVDLTVFTDDVAVADLEKTLLTFVGEVLRDMPDDRAHVDFVVLADFASASEHSGGQDSGAATDLDRAVDHDIGANIGFGVDLGARVNQSGWMDGHETWGFFDLRSRVFPFLQDSLPDSPALRECDTIRPPRSPGRACGNALSRKAGKDFLARRLGCGRSGT